MKKPRQTNKSESASVAQQGNTGLTEQKPTLYVVVRDGMRVSDNDYVDPNDPAAIHEREFWNRVENNHSWGAPVEIVRYDSKRHRVW